VLVENVYISNIISSYFSQKQNVAKFGNDDASGWHQRLPYAKKTKLLMEAELALPTQCKACRFYHDQHCLAWLVRDFLGLQQPVDMWEVMVSAVAEFDNRKYTFVFHQDGHCEDPTNSFKRDGLLGPAAVYALEWIFKFSDDTRFFPMNCRWSHKSFWLSTQSNLFSFRPKKYNLTLSTLPGVRLWPPSTKKPRGRPRMKVLKKARNAPKAAILEFEARGTNQKLATHVVTSHSLPTCSSCGSKGHNASTCKSATIGDMFQRKLSTTNQLAHVSLPPPPPDDIIVVDDDASDIDCTDMVHLATRTHSF
jgi:hypothetical protein